MKRLVLLVTSIFSFSLFATSYVVEMKNKTLTQKQKESLLALDKSLKIEKFTQYSSEYFDRLFLVTTSKIIKKNLETLSFVNLVEENFTADFFEIKPNTNSKLVTNDILFPLQWGLLNQGQTVTKKKVSGVIDEIQSNSAYDIDWEKSINRIEKNLKRSPVVAVVDMGIDLDHPELKNQIYKNEIECDKNGRAKGGTKVDKDNNKYPGDCHGWNFAAPQDIYWQFPFDDKNHGTHISGIIAAAKNNELGMSGVSDKIKILPVRVTGYIDETNARNSLLMKAPSRRIANGILYAVRRGVDVINLSLGWPKTMDTKFMRQVIAEATQKGIVVVAAAGNNNTNANIFPCAYYDVICVGSINIDGNLSAFSNYGGEVDILAPGDQIVSTIPTRFSPLKLNIQGYDILSGTSQAAPFVSATAALLKGVFPKISRAEIMRRLYDSALEKKQDDKSMHGVLQIGKAFLLKPAASIKPVFKNLSDVIFDGKNGNFQFPLNLVNLGTAAKNIKVSISSVDGSLLFKNNAFAIEEYADQKPRFLKVEGRLTHPSVDLLTKIKVRIEADDVKAKEYYHELTLSKNIGTARSRNYGFVFNGKKIPVGFVKDGKVIDNLKTVAELFPSGKLPTYFVKFQDKSKKKGLKLHFFNFVKGKFVQEKKDYVQENAVKLLSVTKGDFNYDGKDDLLIKTIVKKDDEGYVLYSYRNLDMSPSVGELSDIIYDPKVVNVDTKTVRYQKTALSNGMFLATEMFITRGALPKKDQVNDPWSHPDKSILVRPYTMNIIQTDRGTEFEVRSFYNKDFLKVTKASLKNYTHTTVSSENTRIYLLDLKNQTKEEYYKGIVKIFFSYGLGFYRTSFLLDIVGNKRNIDMVNINEKIEHADVIRFSNTDEIQRSYTAFVEYLTNNKLNLTTYGKDKESITYVYDLGTRDDLIQSYLAMFENEYKNYSFIETIDHIVLASIDKLTGETVQTKRKTKKFSFLPGVLMREIFFPMVINSNKVNTPAIYVDSTRISGNHIYVNTISENKIVAPAHLSLNIPKSCATKNPILNKNGFYSYVLICNSKKGYYLKYIDLIY